MNNVGNMYFAYFMYLQPNTINAVISLIPYLFTLQYSFVELLLSINPQ